MDQIVKYLTRDCVRYRFLFIIIMYLVLFTILFYYFVLFLYLFYVLSTFPTDL